MIQVELNPRKFTRWLNTQAQRQVPFATAVALTNLAKAAQTEIRSEIQTSMTLRRPWALRGVQVKAAQKRDGLMGMQAEVGSRDWFMRDQLADASSTRTAPNGKKQFLPKGARSGGKSAVIPKRMRPATVTQNAKASGGSGDGKFFFKTGRGGRSLVYQNLRGDRLRLLYTVGPEQTIRPKISLNDITRGVVLKRGEQEFIRQMGAAIRSGR